MEYGRLREIGERLAERAPDPFRGYEISGDEIVMMMSRSRPHDYAFGDEVTIGDWTLATTDLRTYPEDR
ncbi:hypothetical protein [Streptomyces sp. DASNCL29]|uniref:hypothetical protein n=1 Tax=Streptomyces sp. DASNCL29 TaxID=2583819 RepID=UPI00148624A5|nr:hypothetical protein [Streptomyces sp. DASNCL29]